MRTQTWKLTRIGLLSALAWVLFLIEIPVVAFYKLDLSTFPAILAGFSMGPAAGLAVIAIKDLLHLLQTSSAGVGELADALMSTAFVLPACLFYAREKSRKSAMLGMLVGTLSIAVIGALVNYYILIPFYAQVGMPMAAILGAAQEVIPSIDNLFELVLYITAPFNLLKGIVLSAMTILVYKRVSPLLHRR